MSLAYYMPAAGSYQVKVGAGKFLGVIAPAGGTSFTFTVYDTADGTATAATTLIAARTTTSLTSLTIFDFARAGESSGGVWFNNGLYVVIGGTSQRPTVVYE